MTRHFACAVTTMLLASVGCVAGSRPGSAPPATERAPRAATLRAAESPTPPAATLRAAESPTPPAATLAPESAPPTRAEREIAEVFEQVAVAHGLPRLGPVPSRVVSRDEGIKLIVAKTEEDIPRDVLAAQGEMFAALELAPSDYPFVEGMFTQVKENIAGFYDPDEDAMFLLDDLDDASRATTLAHELVHALQDQHFDLGKQMTYRRGELDRLTALSCLAEGDATAAMLDVTGVPRGALSVDNLRRSLVASLALSPSGLTTPRALQASLISPYVEGYRFVESLRDRGGWDAVNRAWRDPPRSTEQILHLERYEAREAPLAVPVPSARSLGGDMRLLDADVVGELGLRIALEPWSSPPEAVAGAAGWGGDRYALYAKDGDAGRTLAFAWRIDFDDGAEAREAAKLVARRFPPCRERPGLGPLAWRITGATVVMVAGPFVRRADGRVAAAPGASCAAARRWLDELRPMP
ncbi:MAG: hypothetical protein FJ096_11305 [Deltaproteobacteria bacterium]|nr:hypothetical protein [Deltaproteobacteria bacterium]